MPRGPVFGRGRQAAAAAVEQQQAAGCPRCDGGDEDARCRCEAVDRCSEADGAGHQCILGAGHTLRHVTATGSYFR